MAQSDSSVWESVRTNTRSNWFTQMPKTPESAEVTALLVIALSLFSLMALGNLAGLW
ncbi:hypothetical protein ACFQE6_14460 [Natrinema soli]|uniref:Uncharacterized protein n=1 Tax=Natrinema soli TaxID=1930624 RepID=A0ABD5SS81_9EURY